MDPSKNNIVPFSPGQWKINDTPTIVFIDDEPIPRRMMGAWLNSLKITNCIYASLQDLESQFPDKVDLVISDGYLVPEGKRVHDVVKAVRERGFTGPVVLVSQSKFSPEDAYEAGASLFIPKPLRKSTLKQLLQGDSLPDEAVVSVSPTIHDSIDLLPDWLSAMEL